ncbi:acetyl-CoA carboxylase biotin carboxyl carrier protein subunit [Polaribacter sp. SA4-10]|uniref:acetyl-CoA carboxylase biotin carboxyl carrier protein subunit n=1 Tax=Polaribacter sp. SA4-10 TaxID=754397 RepID=UPI000B3BF8A5|nr:acetyl-CoA carboxylase biotin carboxyl carrier protein subunit [Polaribacter sp. SA4-10]ARV06188.1 acetyl-CoA carboxylase biotin carboxyl carrier protein subunit [Polaribacter sp. SA4-10]
MNNQFNVKVNKSLEFDITTDDVINADIVQTSSSKFHILQNNTPFNAEIINADFLQKKYSIKINNNTYDVAISNTLDLLIKDMGFTIGTSKLVNSIKSPMPGLILAVNVAIGDEVKEDDSLLILEAMKMENSILSPRDGIVKAISVTKGEAVDKAQLLIEFE